MYDEPSGRNTKIKKTTLSKELEKGKDKLDFSDGESPSKKEGPQAKGKSEKFPSPREKVKKTRIRIWFNSTHKKKERNRNCLKQIKAKLRELLEKGTIEMILWKVSNE